MGLKIEYWILYYLVQQMIGGEVIHLMLIVAEERKILIQKMV